MSFDPFLASHTAGVNRVQYYRNTVTTHRNQIFFPVVQYYRYAFLNPFFGFYFWLVFPILNRQGFCAISVTTSRSNPTTAA